MADTQAFLRASAWSVALGSSAMVVKGVARMTAGNDLSLVPWFGLGASFGLALAAHAIASDGPGARQARVAKWVASIGTAAALVAVGHLVEGTIPETSGASPVVGMSYGLMSAATFVALLILGVVVARGRLLAGRWRWVPLSVLGAQLPIFIIAGAIGDSLGAETVTDGLGMTLTGGAWVLLAYALTQHE